MTQQAILDAIPHRDPFLLIDQIKEQADERIVCTKTFTGKEYFFHRNELENSSDFDRLVGGENVEFETENSPKGPQAVKVRLTQ